MIEKLWGSLRLQSDFEAKYMRETSYIARPTQEQRILTLLEKRGERGAYVYEFMQPRPDGLGIAQYNARVYGLRAKGYNIVNKTPGHFVLIQTEKPIVTFREDGQGAFI